MWIPIAGSLAVLAALGAGASFWFLRTPEADASTLFEAVQQPSYTNNWTSEPAALCFADGIAHGSGNPVKVDLSNSTTLEWMDRLARLGLYAPRQLRQEAGPYGVQDFAVYPITGDLAKWTNGDQLCVGKGVVAEGVEDIQPVQERPGGGYFSKTVSAKVLWRVEPLAPWVSNPEALDVVNKWRSQSGQNFELAGQKLISRSSVLFMFVDRRWMTRDELMSIKDGADQTSAGKSDGKVEGTPQSNAGSPGDRLNGADLWQRLAGLFSFGNPLIGTWRLDMSVSMKALTGRDVPDDGNGPTIVFTKDAMRQMGMEVPVKYEKDGDTVTVLPQVGPATGVAYRFTMTGKDTFTSFLGTFNRVPQ